MGLCNIDTQGHILLTSSGFSHSSCGLSSNIDARFAVPICRPFSFSFGTCFSG